MKGAVSYLLLLPILVLSHPRATTGAPTRPRSIVTNLTNHMVACQLCCRTCSSIDIAAARSATCNGDMTVTVPYKAPQRIQRGRTMGIVEREGILSVDEVPALIIVVTPGPQARHDVFGTYVSNEAPDRVSLQFSCDSGTTW